jgi:hypothetical protein
MDRQDHSREQLSRGPAGQVTDRARVADEAQVRFGGPPVASSKTNDQLLILVWRVITAAKRRLARMTVKLLSRLWRTRLNQQATTANWG